MLKKTPKMRQDEGFLQILHICPGFTQQNLITLMLNIFGGVPEPFQIFRCQSSSKIGELDLFLKRATQFPVPHLILEVNKLTVDLQEVCVEIMHNHRMNLTISCST